MQMFPLAGIGAVVAATLASLRWVAPLVLAALGIAGPGREEFRTGTAISYGHPVYAPWRRLLRDLPEAGADCREG